MTNNESAPEFELNSGLEKIFIRFLNHRKNSISEN